MHLEILFFPFALNENEISCIDRKMKNMNKKKGFNIFFMKRRKNNNNVSQYLVYIISFMIWL